MRYKWGGLISLEYGRPVKDKSKTTGQYPVFGTNGQIGTSDLSPLCNHASFDINSMDSGSAIPSTDRYEIYAIEVELPPLGEQIVTIPQKIC